MSRKPAGDPKQTVSLSLPASVVRYWRNVAEGQDSTIGKVLSAMVTQATPGHQASSTPVGGPPPPAPASQPTKKQQATAVKAAVAAATTPSKVPCTHPNRKVTGYMTWCPDCKQRVR
jgi:hypothetical protein